MNAALKVLREYGSAIRGDWGDIDGRCVQGALDSIAAGVEGRGAEADYSIEFWREDLGLCPSGEGHWTRHCQPKTTLYAGTEDEYTYGCGNEPSRW